MTDEEAQKVLDELQGVRPEVLNDEAKRLFEAIMKIADERDLLKEKTEKQEKIINEMAKYLASCDTDEDICIKMYPNNGCEDNGIPCRDCIIEYFEKEVRE